MFIITLKISSAGIQFAQTDQIMAQMLTQYMASISSFMLHSSIAFIIPRAYIQRAPPHEITKIFPLVCCCFPPTSFDFRRGRRD